MAAPTDQAKHKYLLLIEGDGVAGERMLTLRARNAGSALLMAQKEAISSPVRLYEDTKCLGRMLLSRGVWLLLPSTNQDKT